VPDSLARPEDRAIREIMGGPYPFARRRTGQINWCVQLQYRALAAPARRNGCDAGGKPDRAQPAFPAARAASIPCRTSYCDRVVEPPGTRYVMVQPPIAGHRKQAWTFARPNCAALAHSVGQRGDP